MTVRSTSPTRRSQSASTSLEVSQRSLVLSALLGDFADNRRLSARVLAQDRLLRAGRVRYDLGPVQPDELFRDLGGGQLQLSSADVALDETQVGDGMEQGKLVASDKAAFVHEPLE